jgi:tRNA threonylcarbamoyladenosine biosynthesis protein TsaB
MLDAGHPLLFLDASGLSTRAALWQNSRWLAFREDPAPALTALFTSTRAILAEAGLTLPQIAVFLYVNGPGSVLGLRLAAMAIRTWQADTSSQPTPPHPRPIFSCGSLHLAAALALAGGAQPPFTVCTDARQGRWHLLEVPTANPSALAQTLPREADAPELAQLPGPLFYLPARKTWQNLPRPSAPPPATLRDHPEILSTPSLFHPVPAATPFSAAAPEYRKWENPAAAH